MRSEKTLASKMKYKLSVSLDGELTQELAKALSNGKFRNRSHLVEYAVKRLTEAKFSDGLEDQDG